MTAFLELRKTFLTAKSFMPSEVDTRTQIPFDDSCHHHCLHCFNDRRSDGGSREEISTFNQDLKILLASTISQSRELPRIRKINCLMRTLNSFDEAKSVFLKKISGKHHGNTSCRV
jgi:hypothetical protein